MILMLGAHGVLHTGTSGSAMCRKWNSDWPVHDTSNAWDWQESWQDSSQSHAPNQEASSKSDIGAEPKVEFFRNIVFERHWFVAGCFP